MGTEEQRGCIITTGEQGINIKKVGTGDTYYNRGNRGYKLHQGEQGINITSGGTGDKYYIRGNRGYKLQ